MYNFECPKGSAMGPWSRATAGGECPEAAGDAGCGAVARRASAGLFLWWQFIKIRNKSDWSNDWNINWRNRLMTLLGAIEFYQNLKEEEWVNFFGFISMVKAPLRRRRVVGTHITPSWLCISKTVNQPWIKTCVGWVVHFTSFRRSSICDCVILVIDPFTQWLCGDVLPDISLDPFVCLVIFEMRAYVQSLIILKMSHLVTNILFLSVTKRPSINMLSRFQGCLFLGASWESPRFYWKQRSNLPNSGTHKTFWTCFIFPQSRQITTRRDMDDRDFVLYLCPDSRRVLIWRKFSVLVIFEFSGFCVLLFVGDLS